MKDIVENTPSNEAELAELSAGGTSIVRFEFAEPDANKAAEIASELDDFQVFQDHMNNTLAVDEAAENASLLLALDKIGRSDPVIVTEAEDTNLPGEAVSADANNPSTSAAC